MRALLLIQGAIDITPAAPSGMHPEGETPPPCLRLRTAAYTISFWRKLVEETPYLHPETHGLSTA